MSRLQQGSLLRLKRKTGPDVWVFRWYEELNGIRTYRKRTIGTVVRFPHRRDAEKIVDALRNNINVEFKVPETVAELVTPLPRTGANEGEEKPTPRLRPTLTILRTILSLDGDPYICRMSAL